MTGCPQSFNICCQLGQQDSGYNKNAKFLLFGINKTPLLFKNKGNYRKKYKKYN
jgi:hypothetical protein